MAMYGREAVVTALLDTHLNQANTILEGAGSALLKKGFQKGWADVGHSSISAGIDSTFIDFNLADIKSDVDGWISQFEDLSESEQRIYDGLTDPTPEQFMRLMRILRDSTFIQQAYGQIKNELDDAEKQFENTVRVFRSPMRQTLNDATIMYNTLNNIKRNFSEFKNVSVYVHGIESDGEDFLKSVTKAANPGEYVAHMERNGEKVYYEVIINKKGKQVLKKVNRNGMVNSSKDKRIHIVYDTEQQNEHRQETSDDLAEKLTQMGLINDHTKIDLFGHSYGGRRSFQFAMDFPDHVQSVTTIGTPYDTNTLGDLANKHSTIAGWANFHTKDYSGYLDPNDSNRRTDDGVEHSNVYTDMSSEPMNEDVNNLKAANPEVYEKLKDMDITAAAGYRTEYTVVPYSFVPPKKYKTGSDDVVSVESQNAESLKGLIDERPQYEVDGSGLLDPGHVHEIKNEDFVNLIHKVNNDHIHEGVFPR